MGFQLGNRLIYDKEKFQARTCKRNIPNNH